METHTVPLSLRDLDPRTKIGLVVWFAIKYMQQMDICDLDYAIHQAHLHPKTSGRDAKISAILCHLKLKAMYDPNFNFSDIGSCLGVDFGPVVASKTVRRAPPPYARHDIAQNTFV